MLYAIHLLVVAVYVILPAAAVGLGLRAWRRGRRGMLFSVLLTCGTGLALGAALCVVYAAAIGARPGVGQVLLAGYFATGLMLVLKVLDAGVLAAVRWGFRLRSRGAGRGGTVRWRVRWAGALLSRLIVMSALALPYVMASAMTYRPKMVPRDDPRSLLGFAFEPVSFEATDGTRLAGWWLPARDPDRRTPRTPEWGRRTVVVCHGLAAGKANQLVLARKLVPAGFNVLIFDFRAHGASGGQLTTFGDFERRDVLGAVRWARANRPAQSAQVFGVGASMGAAALVAAAAEDTDDGRAIAAVAVYGTYDALPGLLRSITGAYFVPPLRQLVGVLGLPIASMQSGARLTDFVPGRLAQRLWPRPVLVIHGTRDEVIDFAQGQALFDHATQPKSRLWIERGGHNDIINGDAAADEVVDFLTRARPVPVI